MLSSLYVCLYKHWIGDVSFVSINDCGDEFFVVRKKRIYELTFGRKFGIFIVYTEVY